MNKSEEYNDSLEMLIDVWQCEWRGWGWRTKTDEERNSDISNACLKLKELVDRATPIKPVKQYVYDDFENTFYEINVCPKCECEVYANHSCSDND